MDSTGGADSGHVGFCWRGGPDSPVVGGAEAGKQPPDDAVALWRCLVVRCVQEWVSGSAGTDGEPFPDVHLSGLQPSHVCQLLSSWLTIPQEQEQRAVGL